MQKKVVVQLFLGLFVFLIISTSYNCSSNFCNCFFLDNLETGPLEDTIIFSGKAISPYLNGRVDGAKLVISRIKDYKEDKRGKINEQMDKFR